MKTFFFQSGEFFCLFIATAKTRLVLTGLSDQGGKQWVKSWGHDEKVMCSSRDMKT